MSAVTVRPVRDTIVRQQMLIDQGAQSLDGHPDTTNMTAFASYADPDKRLTRTIFTKGIQYLADCHPYLRSAFKIENNLVYQIVLKDPKVPITFTKETVDPELWRDLVAKDLSKRFVTQTEPFWRVIFAEGYGTGQIFLTFHHAISDGKAAAQRMHELFVALSKLMKNETPVIVEIDPDKYPTEELFAGLKTLGSDTSPKLQEKPPKYEPCRTDFVRHVMDENLTSRMERLAHVSGKRFTVHSLLFAAFIKAVWIEKNPAFKEFTCMSIVSVRKELNGDSAMKPMYTSLITHANALMPFMELAECIHKDLHGQLERGEHLTKLKQTQSHLEHYLSPAEWMKECKMPPNTLNLSNIGVIPFEGRYGNLEMTTLDAAAGCTPFFDYGFLLNGFSMSLAVRTFQGQLRIVACFPRRQSDPSSNNQDVLLHREILKMIESILRRNLALSRI